MGLKTPAERAVLPYMSEKSFVIDSDVLKALREDSQTWENFQKFPPLYQRIRIDYIQRTKRHKAMYENRLKNFTEKTKHYVWRIERSRKIVGLLNYFVMIFSY